MAHKDNRQHNISVSLSDDEYTTLMLAVIASGMVKTKFCRMRLLMDTTSEAIESRRKIKEYNKIFMPIGRNLNSAYMAMRENGVNEKTIAKMEIALEDFSKITEEYFG